MTSVFRPEEAVSSSGWETVREELVGGEQSLPLCNDQEIDSKTLPVTQDEEGNKMLSFYCIDMYEDHYKKPGTVYLFGKVALQASTYIR